VDVLLEPQYKLSRHLKTLRQTGLLSSQKEGRWVYHRLTSEPAYLRQLYDLIRALPDPEGVYHNDLENFNKRMALRQDGRCRVGVLTDEFKAGEG